MILSPFLCKLSRGALVNFRGGIFAKSLYSDNLYHILVISLIPPEYFLMVYGRHLRKRSVYSVSFQNTMNVNLVHEELPQAIYKVKMISCCLPVLDFRHRKQQA